MMPQPSLTQTERQATVIAPGGLVIEQQRQPFGMAEAGRFVIGGKIGKRVCHADEAKLAKQVEGWMFQHALSFQW
jgi:hypothetical protein